MFAFLGVNGAGKSTTISILCGLLKKDSGTVQVNGIETDKAGAQTKRMLGVVFQDNILCESDYGAGQGKWNKEGF